jgi:hypothetical protein
MVDASGSRQEIAPIVQHPHEWFGQRIRRHRGRGDPAQSRIIALCDAFDSMTRSQSRSRRRSRLCGGRALGPARAQL